MPVHQVKDKDDFNAQLNNAGDKLVAVDFYAVWCGPCKVIAPKIEAMSETITDVVFLKVDVDENDELGAELKITCMPTFLFFKNGEKVDSFSGADENKFKAILSKHLGRSV